MATATTPAMPSSIHGPIASTVAALTLAPSRTTATSSRVLAENSMPGLQRAPGGQAVRTAVPIRIASTSASSQARPKRAASACSRARAARVTATQSATPGKTRIGKGELAAGTIAARGCGIGVIFTDMILVLPGRWRNGSIGSNAASRSNRSLPRMDGRVTNRSSASGGPVSARALPPSGGVPAAPATGSVPRPGAAGCRRSRHSVGTARSHLCGRLADPPGTAG